MKILTITVFTTILILGINNPAKCTSATPVTQVSDIKSEEKVYIPKDLDDCFDQLAKILQPSDLDKMKAGSEKDMIQYHRNIGMWMRNNWGLWGGSRLKQYFHTLGINHPDDMSGIILDSFWRYLHGQPIRLEEQIKSYQDYWKKENKNK